MSESHEPPQGRPPLHVVESRVSRSRDDAPAQDGQNSPALEPRMLAAWREWLAALASDADAALAAADLYAGLAPDARDAWLNALAEDGPSLDVPALALYAPLLGVETDPDRRARMEMAVALGSEGSGGGRQGHVDAPAARALSGMTSSGARVVALIQPVYLQFVRVLWCRFVPDEGIHWARHDSLLANAHAPKHGEIVDGVMLERTPQAPIVEELAHAILAQKRRGSELPISLCEFADLFGTDVEALDGMV